MKGGKEATGMTNLFESGRVTKKRGPCSNIDDLYSRPKKDMVDSKKKRVIGESKKTLGGEGTPEKKIILRGYIHSSISRLHIST